MAPKRRNGKEEEAARSHDYWKRKRDEFDSSKVKRREYGDSTKYLQKYIKGQWDSYFAVVEADPDQALREFVVRDLYNFLDWLIEESKGSIDSARSLQTYWNVLCIVRRQETAIIDIDPVTKYDMMNGRRELVKKHGLRTDPKEKPIMRAEDEFECLKTLLSSPELVFEMEIHRIGMILITQLAGTTGNRPKALLQLRFKNVAVAWVPDPNGSEWPRPLVEWKFNDTKTYLGDKDANTIPIPDIPNEPCLLLCPHIPLLAIGFLRNAFDPETLTPKTFYNLKVPPGQGQLKVPWKEEMLDEYLFPRSVRTAIGLELDNEQHFQYNCLRDRLRKIGEVTGIELPVGAYCFRRGAGEGMDSSSNISDAQRNLCLQHAPNSTVFQTNYLSHHVTGDLAAAYRGLEPQTAIMRYATGMSRTIDKRRPKDLTTEQQKEAHRHPKVQQLLQKKLELKAQLKAPGKTIQSHAGSPLYIKYQQKKRAYESEFEFQKKALRKEIKKKFEKEQPVIDIQNQIHGLTVKMENNNNHNKEIKIPTPIIPERIHAVEALLTFTTSSPEEERKRRINAVNALIALGRIQDGRRFPTVRCKRELANPPLPLDCTPTQCAPTQCFLCLGNKYASLEKRTRRFHSRGGLKKHILRYHVENHYGHGPIICPIDETKLSDAMHVLNHAHTVHRTPTLLCR